jgi:hypothetical protein
MRPITTDAEYEELVRLSDEFLKTVGPRLQRYLWIKSWMSVNYVCYVVQQFTSQLLHLDY